MGETVKKQNYVLHSLCAIILLILTAVKFDLRADIYNNLVALGRFAIPMFLVISGYFLYSEDGHTKASLPRKIRHILILTIAVKLLFLAIDIVYYSAGIIDLDYVINAFVTSEDTTQHVWFVYALLMMYVFWFIMFYFNLNVEKISIPITVIILAVLMAVCVVLPICGVKDLFGLSVRLLGDILYPFVAFPFFTIGYLLHEYREAFDAKFSTPALIVLSVAGLFSPAIAAVWIPGSTLYFGSIVAAVCIFMLTFRVPEGRMRCRFLEFAGWKLKMYLYMFFPAVIFFLKNVVMVSMNIDSAAYIWIGTAASVILNLFFSYLAYRLVRAVSKPRKKQESARPSA